MNEQKQNNESLYERRVLNAAMDAGHILLQNGAEISRVEETMERVCRHYGVMTGKFFVLSMEEDENIVSETK